MKSFRIGLAVFFVTLLYHSLIYALEKTSTGFYWPIGISNFNQACGGWLARDSSYDGCYFSGLYHIGVDMMKDGEVYAISDGEVFHKHCDDDSWGPGNCALFIEHTTANGVIFTGLYGHIRTTKNIGDSVDAGKPLGATGPWGGGMHLHFGIRLGNSTLPSPWGRLPNANWPNRNDFIDPIDFIENNAPYIDFSDDSQPIEATVRKDGEAAWYPPNVGCLDADVWFRITDIDCYFADRSICYEAIGICPDPQ